MQKASYLNDRLKEIWWNSEWLRRDREENEKSGREEKHLPGWEMWRIPPSPLPHSVSMSRLTLPLVFFLAIIPLIVSALDCRYPFIPSVLPTHSFTIHQACKKVTLNPSQNHIRSYTEFHETYRSFVYLKRLKCVRVIWCSTHRFFSYAMGEK